MGFFLGIDGGGTKTECVLADEAGAVLARAMGRASNVRLVKGEQLRQNLTECFELLRQNAGVRELRPAVVCAGFAGASDGRAREQAKTLLAELLQPRALYVVGDMEVALEAAVGDGPGAVLIAGTGSIAYGRNAAGRTARAGGEGPKLDSEGNMVGDVGSARYFAWRFLQATRTASPREISSSVLFRPLLQALQLTAGELKETASALGFGVGVETSVEQAVLAAAQDGDALATRIRDDAADGLAKLAVAVLQDLELDDGLVALGGGVLLGSVELAAAVRARILAAAPRVRVGPLQVSPAEGAVRLGQRLWLEEQRGG